jgi:pilus assembly protein Flp/PilA
LIEVTFSVLGATKDTRMAKIVLKFLRGGSGVSAIEYGLIATGIAIAIVTAISWVRA